MSLKNVLFFFYVFFVFIHPEVEELVKMIPWLAHTLLFHYTVDLDSTR